MTKHAPRGAGEGVRYRVHQQRPPEPPTNSVRAASRTMELIERLKDSATGIGINVV
jgi:hypothetical protein